MNRSKPDFLFILLTGVLLLTLNMNLFPHFLVHRLSVAYSEPLAKLTMTDDSMEGKINSAAGYFFKGRASIQKLLVMIELKDIKGINSSAIDSVLGAALVNIQTARDIYQQIVTRAVRTPYNQSTLSLLQNFPYDEMLVNEGLNKPIFAKVKTFLKNGNCTGIIKSIVLKHNTMISLLKKITKDFGAGKVPEIVLFWKLNETAAETALIGSYTTRVFALLK